MQPAATTAPTTDQLIVATMSVYEEVIRDGRTEPIATLTDSAPIRRFLTSAAAASPPSDGADHRSYSVLATRTPIPGIVEAELARSDGLHLRLLFRQLGPRWVLTEPSAEELGERVELQRGRLTIESFAAYPYTDEAIAAIESAYQQVEQFFGTMPDQPLRVVLKPAFGIGTMLPFDVQAISESGRRPRITITVPWSIAFRPYDATSGWQATVSHLVAHELTHFVHATQPAYAGVNQVPTWVAEGLAEYVAAPLRLDAAQTIDARDGWLPFTAETPDAASLLSLDKLGPRDRAVAYIQSQLLIAYLAHEDRESLWRFVDAYAAAPGTGAAKLDAALQQSLNTSLNQFVEEWRFWVRGQLRQPATP